MIRLGDFSFPPGQTAVQVEMVEAKSKVRKQAHIVSLLIDGGPESHRDRIERLRAAAEAFDRQQAALSLRAGRHYLGRRRRLKLAPHPNGRYTWVELTVLTNDRYERGDELRRSEQDMHGGVGEFALCNRGNWLAPLHLTLTLGGAANQVRVEAGPDPFVLDAALQAGHVLQINSERCEASVEGVNLYPMTNQAFPRLPPGVNLVRILVEPQAVFAHCAIEYRDTWI